MSSSQRRKKMWSSFAKSSFCHTSGNSLCACHCTDTCIKINSDVFQRSISVLKYYANDSSLILILDCWFLVTVFLIFSSFILFYMPVLQTIPKHLAVSEIDQLCERQLLARDRIHSKQLLYPWLLYFSLPPESLIDALIYVIVLLVWHYLSPGYHIYGTTVLNKLFFQCMFLCKVLVSDRIPHIDKVSQKITYKF